MLRGQPAAVADLRKELSRLEVAGKHAPIEVGHLQRGSLDARLDVGELLPDPLLRERAGLAHVRDAVVAERARVRAPARRLDHRRELVVEELVQEAHRVGRWEALVELQNPRQQLTANELAARHVVHAGELCAAGLESRGVEVDFLQSLEKADESHFPFAVDVEVDLRALFEVLLLFRNVNRVVRAPHDDDRVRMPSLDFACEGAAQTPVPHVVAERGDGRRLFRQERARSVAGYLNSCGIDLVAKVSFRVRGDVPNGQRDIVGVHGYAGMSQFREADCRHEAGPLRVSDR